MGSMECDSNRDDAHAHAVYEISMSTSFLAIVRVCQVSYPMPMTTVSQSRGAEIFNLAFALFSQVFKQRQHE
jgi:hypothetical protein